MCPTATIALRPVHDGRQQPGDHVAAVWVLRTFGALGGRIVTSPAAIRRAPSDDRSDRDRFGRTDVECAGRPERHARLLHGGARGNGHGGCHADTPDYTHTVMPMTLAPSGFTFGRRDDDDVLASGASSTSAATSIRRHPEHSWERPVEAGRDARHGRSDQWHEPVGTIDAPSVTFHPGDGCAR